jgi:hypothetical protein
MRLADGCTMIWRTGWVRIRERDSTKGRGAQELVDVGVLELIIVPDKSGGEARASLVKMRLS